DFRASRVCRCGFADRGRAGRSWSGLDRGRLSDSSFVQCRSSIGLDRLRHRNCLIRWRSRTRASSTAAGGSESSLNHIGRRQAAVVAALLAWSRGTPNEMDVIRVRGIELELIDVGAFKRLWRATNRDVIRAWCDLDEPD